ncbi:hypothetical protein DPMN_050599 [Dreissena polymorpha]|uniref:Uncharacterized protein n=1 Tax=Dreissena polymorpha TaxID=45954 RepID=A0A9D4CI61_DREPO|nr:hypothetical protein DPMN_050599 [Dreissena polymorpha]
MRENHATLSNALKSAIHEQSVRARFELRSQINGLDNITTDNIQTDIDYVRSSIVCTYCKKHGHSIEICRRRQREISAYTDDEENIPLAELQKHLRNKQFADIQSSSSESDTMHYNNGNSQNSPVRRFENDSSDDQMQIDAVALKHKKRKLTKKTSRSNNAIKKAIFTCLQTMAEHM